MKRKSTLAVLVFALLLSYLLPTAGVTLARYVNEKSASGAAIAEPFYFRSDKLRAQPALFWVDAPDGGGNASFTFTVYNYVDDLRVNPREITFRWKTTSAAEVDSDWHTDNGRLLPDENAGGKASREMTVSVPSADFGSDGEVLLTLATTAPYEKTLTARLKLRRTQELLAWNPVPQGNAVVLQIESSEAQSVEVHWPSGLTPDLSQNRLTGISGNSGVMTLSGGRDALVFLQQSDYDADQFNVAPVS